MGKYLSMMRVHHYIKNLLVFVALICSGNLFAADKFIGCLYGFVAFSAISSAVYIINDIKDVDKDRLHPKKKQRPIASGAVSITKASIMLSALLLIAFYFNYLAFDFISTLFILCYFILNIGYSFGLKNIPLIDVTILVSGFLLRILYGSVIANIKISHWLYLTVLVFALYFALGIRRNEIRQLGNGTTRKVLEKYSISFLDKSMNMCITLGIVFYTLWSMDEITVSLYNSDKLVYTVPIVLFIILKYSMNVEGDSDGDPVEVLIHDKILIVLCILYLAIMFSILYQ